jgi:hypothetical protein
MPLVSEISRMLADWWPMLALPLLAAGAAGLCAWLSLKLLFGPVSIMAGGRGILQRRNEMVADRLAAALGGRIRLAELFRLMEPEKVAAHVSAALLERLDEHVDDVMAERYSVLWANLPQALRQRVYGRIRRQLPYMLDNLVEDMAENVDELVEMRQLIAGLTQERQSALAELLGDALSQERRFLVRAAVWTGLALGILQAVLWVYFPSPQLLVAQAVVIALAALLVPRARLLAAGSRDAASSAATFLARRLSEDMFGLERLMQMMLTGARESRTRSMIRRHMRPLLDAGLVRTSIQMLLGIEAYAYIKQQVVDRVSGLTMTVLAHSTFPQQQCAKVEAVCVRQLKAMPAAEMGGLLQSVLDEGLWIRLSVAAAAGLVLGGVELALVQGIGM